MLRMRPNAAASSRYFVPSGCATIVSATNPRNDGSAKGFGASEIQQVREGRSGRVRRRRVTVEAQRRLADDEERVLADKERAYADGDGQRRDIHGHGILESVGRDGFIHRSLPEPRWTDGEEGHVHAAAIPAENLAIRELRRVA